MTLEAIPADYARVASRTVGGFRPEVFAAASAFDSVEDVLSLVVAIREVRLIWGGQRLDPVDS